LKLELVVDTTKVPLAARIRPNVQPATPNPLRQKIQARNSVHIPKGRPVKPNRAVSRNKKLAPKKQPKKKKTIEELDQEMADYFANNDK
jgi:THO complex subunit 4